MHCQKTLVTKLYKQSYSKMLASPLQTMHLQLMISNYQLKNLNKIRFSLYLTRRFTDLFLTKRIEKLTRTKKLIKKEKEG